MERRGSQADPRPALRQPVWDGQCFYGSLDALVELDERDVSKVAPLQHKATSISFNVPFSLVAVGLQKYVSDVYGVFGTSASI